MVYLHGSLTAFLSRAAFPPWMEIKRCLFAQALKPGLPVTWVADLSTSCSSLRARLGHMGMNSECGQGDQDSGVPSTKQFPIQK